MTWFNGNAPPHPFTHTFSFFFFRRGVCRVFAFPQRNVSILETGVATWRVDFFPVSISLDVDRRRCGRFLWNLPSTATSFTGVAGTFLLRFHTAGRIIQTRHAFETFLDRTFLCALPFSYFCFVLGGGGRMVARTCLLLNSWLLLLVRWVHWRTPAGQTVGLPPSQLPLPYTAVLLYLPQLLQNFAFWQHLPALLNSYLPTKHFARDAYHFSGGYCLPPPSPAAARTPRCLLPAGADAPSFLPLCALHFCTTKSTLPSFWFVMLVRACYALWYALSYLRAIPSVVACILLSVSSSISLYLLSHLNHSFCATGFVVKKRRRGP